MKTIEITLEDRLACGIFTSVTKCLLATAVKRITKDVVIAGYSSFTLGFEKQEFLLNEEDASQIVRSYINPIEEFKPFTITPRERKSK